MRALIIGSSGFLGTHLLELLHEENLQVDCCDREQAAVLEEIEPVYDRVFLLAAHIPYGKLEEESKLLEESNVGLAKRVVDHFFRSRIIFSSSVSVYGDSTISPLTENSRLAPSTAYAKSKLQGENIIRTHRSYAILRFPSIYGPGMTAETFLPKIVRDALTKQEITLYGSGERLQNYLYVKDAAKMLLLAAQSKENFLANAVFPAHYSNKELAELVAGVVGSVKINYTGQDSSRSFSYSLDKWQRLFDYLPETTLEQGITLLIENVRQQLKA